jgi:hypothetical protein
MFCGCLVGRLLAAGKKEHFLLPPAILFFDKTEKTFVSLICNDLQARF